ncbi:unnamed protein product [Mytilus edulis]|uniref:Fibronectin type-III domain-containing protein n=1 Tax=Mytilus edulis TaxID=6550 RepID=A0A8S3QY63_MYTED|nr:unnamed protein product [Mytilus edulis]
MDGGKRSSTERHKFCNVKIRNVEMLLARQSKKNLGSKRLTIGPTSVYIENVDQDNKILGIEGQDMTIKCTSMGGQPPPDIKLVILGSNYTGSRSAQHTFKPHSSDDGSTVTCQAGYNQINFNPLSTFAYIHLMFKPVITAFDPETLSTDENKLFVSSYAPGVTVNNKTFPLYQSHRQIDSTLDSNPTINTCTWRHKSTYGKNIRDFIDNNQTLTLPTVPADKRYQDTGEYVCTAENGIIGINEQLKQTGSGYVICNEVELDGYTVTLAISDLQKSDFTNYTLRLYYGSQYVQHDVTLESASAPETPSNFSITSSRQTSITVQWIPGYDGGQKQTFYLQYRTTGKNTWVHKVIKTDSKPGKQSFYTLSGLQEKTTYELRMYAQNAFNQSRKTDIEATTTQQSVFTEAQTSPNAVTGAVAGVLVVLLIVCAIITSIVLLKRENVSLYINMHDQGFPL